MIIQNYGLFWLRDNVSWGGTGAGNKGALEGRCVGAIYERPVEFCEQKGVYVLYDQNFKVVYVGQTGGGEQRLLARLRQHRRDHLSQRWSRFSWFGILPVSTDGNLKAKFTPARPSTMSVLNHIEAIVIAVSEPPLNRQGGKFGETVKQYIQVSPAAKPADDDN